MMKQSNLYYKGVEVYKRGIGANVTALMNIFTLLFIYELDKITFLSLMVMSTACPS